RQQADPPGATMARHPRRISSLSRPDYQETPSSFERKNYSSFEQAATQKQYWLVQMNRFL
ncbi:MAG: hypothetical protein P1U90_02845, partial [Akkermansiaceae bacterium]|nr:hypothetical protein [Akkermansiaceae bacterium]